MASPPEAAASPEAGYIYASCFVAQGCLQNWGGPYIFPRPLLLRIPKVLDLNCILAERPLQLADLPERVNSEAGTSITFVRLPAFLTGTASGDSRAVPPTGRLYVTFHVICQSFARPRALDPRRRDPPPCGPRPEDAPYRRRVPRSSPGALKLRDSCCGSERRWYLLTLSA
jgi:hypothetical protein